MASVGEVTLEITESTNPGDVRISVRYAVTGSGHDKEIAQHYREVCRIVGQDLGESDNFIVGATLYDRPTVFTEEEGSLSRTLEKVLPSSALNEDSFATDEIQAIVTLTPIPTSRKSNRIKREFGGPFS